MTASERTLRSLRRRYLASLDLLETASQELEQHLDEATAARSVVRRHLREGGDVGAFEQVVEPGLRTTLSNALDNFERARHNAQRQLFLLMHVEGFSMSAIGEMWGISRQLVSRLINEPD